MVGSLCLAERWSAGVFANGAEMKYLILLGVIALLWAYFSWRNEPESSSPPASERPPERMVTCAQCGLNLPISDGIADADGCYYCSEAHRRLGGRKES